MTEANHGLKSWKGSLTFVTDALAFEWYRAPNCKKQLLSALFGFVLLAATSFFMLWLGDRINAPGMAVTRFLARAQAPLTAELAYPSQARSQISVLMYDSEFLNSQGTAWPMSYQEHADWLGRLVELPGAKPKALMIDITFGQERNDPSINALKEKLCDIRRVHNIPVYLAALPDVTTGRLSVRDGLAPQDGAGQDACFTLVGVDYVPDPLDGLAWSYQLNRHFDGQAWTSGLPPSDRPAPTYRSAALAMAEDSAGIKLAVSAEPMALMWGFTPAQQSDRPELIRGCDPGEWDWTRWIPRLIRQLWESGDRAPLCPYHRTLSFGQVAELEESTLSEFVADKFVFIGANIPGYNDVANSPVHGVVPGVYMHAMALDNFLSFGADYKISADWTLPPHPELVVPGLVSVGIVFLVNLGWQWLKSRLKVEPVALRQVSGSGSLHQRVRAALTKPREAPECSAAASSNFGQRLLESMASISGWVLRISLQSFIAVLLISVLQFFFRIGMLPVVELVGMTLVAEGLGYLSRIKWLLSGPKVNKFCQYKKETPSCKSKPAS